jgi:hypothetical protein
MKGLWAATAVALGLVGQVAAEGLREEKRATEATRPTFRISARVVEIDVASGTENTVHQPRLYTQEAKPAAFLIGGFTTVPVAGGGVSFEEFGFGAVFFVKSLEGGNLKIDAELRSSNPTEKARRRATCTDQIPAGRTLRREIFKDDKKSVIYRVEYTVEDARPSREVNGNHGRHANRH